MGGIYSCSSAHQVAARQSFRHWISLDDKREYKHAVRKLKRHSEELHMDNLGCQLLEGSTLGFWKKVNMMKSSRKVKAVSINGLSD